MRVADGGGVFYGTGAGFTGGEAGCSAGQFVFHYAGTMRRWRNAWRNAELTDKTNCGILQKNLLLTDFYLQGGLFYEAH